MGYSEINEKTKLFQESRTRLRVFLATQRRERERLDLECVDADQPSSHVLLPFMLVVLRHPTFSHSQSLTVETPLIFGSPCVFYTELSNSKSLFVMSVFDMRVLFWMLCEMFYTGGSASALQYLAQPESG